MKVLLAEFNELSPLLMEKFIDEGKLPNFKRFRDESQVYVTESEDEPHLEPWVQWVTLHAGIPYSEHGIENLGDGHKLGVDSIWDVVSDAGKKVWVCGSMNIDYRKPINGWVLPDPWSTNVDPYPADELHDYFRFISANVQEYTREDTPLSRSDQVAFLKFMAKHGLSPSTVTNVVGQLARERRNDVHWQRAVLLDLFQFDLFRWYFKREQPALSTFFLNSTAHYQHLYWRNMEPEHFKIKPDAGEQAVYQDAILFGYERMDKIAGELLKLADDDTTLVLTTALSQQPCLTYEESGGKVIHRPKDFDQLMKLVGIEGAQVSPVMAEEFQIHFTSGAEADAAEEKLTRLRKDGEPILSARRDGTDIMSGCMIWEEQPEDATLSLEGGSDSIPFFDLFYKIDLLKSGMHHPDGILWIREPSRRHQVHMEKIELARVAPTLLEMMDVEVPAHMRGTPLAPVLSAARV